LSAYFREQFCSNQPRTPVRAGMLEDGSEVIVDDRVVKEGISG
jgi:hypothetical protein